MSLPLDLSSDDYKFHRTLNEDVKIRPVSETSQHWDLKMADGDYINVTGYESLKNAICIAIMTRFTELDEIPLYDEFGCRVHELVKANKSEMVRYKIELFVTEVLENMRRVASVESVKVSDDEDYSYLIEFSVISISDAIINGSVVI